MKSATSFAVGCLAGVFVTFAIGVSATPQAGEKKALMGAVKAIGPYTPGVSAGDMVFLSGQLGLEPASGNLIAGGTKAEAKQAMENLGALLKEAGLGYENVVKTTIYVTDIKEFADVNEVYGSFFAQGSTTPARSTVQVAALPRGGHVEIDFVAVK